MSGALSKALTDFQAHCQEIYICYSMAVVGIDEHAKKISSHSPDLTKNLIVGVGHPDSGNWQGSMKIGKYLEASKRDGAFSDLLAKAFVAQMYSLWDEYYRHQLAAEIGADPGSLKSDLMGDLRKIRHCILHRKAVISDEGQHLRVLKWKLLAGPLIISETMFQELIDQINGIQVRVEEA